MIPPYPPTGAERDAIRLAYWDRAALEAARRAARYALSIRCAEGDHGCRNDGSGCLCRCHDRRRGPQ